MAVSLGVFFAMSALIAGLALRHSKVLPGYTWIAIIGEWR